jgi:hypothetical protein
MSNIDKLGIEIAAVIYARGAEYHSPDRQIKQFNEQYKMPKIDVSDKTATDNRLVMFEKILQKELAELSDILACTDAAAREVAIADWLTDICVYCQSEMERFSLPITAMHYIVMESNKSKLDANGNAIWSELGKLEKGPNYWKPEPMMAAVLAKLRSEKARDEA